MNKVKKQMKFLLSMILDVTHFAQKILRICTYFFLMAYQVVVFYVVDIFNRTSLAEASSVCCIWQLPV